MDLLSINLKKGADPSLEWSDELYDGELYEFQSIGLGSGDSIPLPENWKADVLQARRPGHTPSHEVLQVLIQFCNNVAFIPLEINCLCPDVYIFNCLFGRHSISWLM